MAILKVENLSFTYPNTDKPALNDISLTVNEGEMLLICGTSGCGKSTLLRHFKSILAPYGKKEGQILFYDTPLDNMEKREQAKRIGFVMQHPDDQIVTDKVWHELAFGLESLGMEQSEMRLRIGEMASYFGIQNWFYKNVTELSGGQKQLLNLASVMALDPDILILDEPTSQLDPIAAAEFLSTLRKLNRELGITVIFTEHRLEEAFSIADRVLVMERGKGILCDIPQKVATDIEIGSDIYHAMPTAAKLYRELDFRSSCSLTVREARQKLLTLDLKKQVITEQSEKTSKGEKILELAEIWFRYEKESEDVLRGLSLCVNKGEIYSIVGGNGTGKSTTLSVIAGINRAYRGHIRINGKKCKAINPKEQGIAVLTQDPRTLFVSDSVEKDLLEMVSDVKCKENKQEEISKAVELMEIFELMKKHPFDLSGGEQQRVAMAKVLLMKPQIMLLDEPTKGMDAHFKMKFGELLKKLASDGMTILIVSHDIEFCAKYSDRCGLFFDGCVISENAPREFFSGNHFYTTVANRIARSFFPNAILTEEVVELCRKQIQMK